MADMYEQEKSDKLEELCGGPDGAFRLMRIYSDVKTYVLTRGPRLSSRYPVKLADMFKKSAKEKGFSDEAIAHYLKM